MPALSAPAPMTLGPVATARRPTTVRAMALSTGLHLVLATSAILLMARPDRQVPLPVIPVELVAADAIDLPDPAVKALARSVLASESETPAEGTQADLPAVSLPGVPVKLRAPRIATRMADAMVAPDAPPPLPPPDAVDLQSFMTRQAAVPSGLPARPHADNPAPDYPAEAKRLGLQGDVLLQVTVSPEGRPTDVAVLESSGWALLDDAAIETVRRWRFDPARAPTGPARSAKVEVPLTFRLGRG